MLQIFAIRIARSLVAVNRGADVLTGGVGVTQREEATRRIAAVMKQELDCWSTFRVTLDQVWPRRDAPHAGNRPAF